MIYKGYPLLSLKVEYEQTHTGQYYLAWYDQHDEFHQEWTDYRARLWPSYHQPPYSGFVDTFDHIPVLPGAAKAFLGMTYNPDRNPALGKSVELMGHSLNTIHSKNLAHLTLKPHPVDEVGQFIKADFGSVKPKWVRNPIANRGVSMTLPRIKAAYHLNAQHQVTPFAKNQSTYLSPMMVPVIMVETHAGEKKTIWANGADGISANWDPDHHRLHLRIYAYHYLEHTLLVHQESPAEAPQKDHAAVRHHPNLALTKTLPEQNLSVVITKTDQVAFPLWQPKGYLATLILTEHADYQEPKTEPLLMYGNQAHRLVKGQGILGNRIPLTKSIFVLGEAFAFKKTMPDGRQVPFIQASYEGNANFRGMMHRYLAAGYPMEFGPHTPGTRHYQIGDTTRALEMLKALKAKIWIDHGSSPGMMMRGGWDKDEADYYMVDALHEKGYEYIWADGDRYPMGEQYGDINLTKAYQPANVLYTVPRIEAIQKNTKPLRFFSTGIYQWSGRPFRQTILDKLLSDHGIAIIHCYLPYHGLNFTLNQKGDRIRDTLAPWYNPSLKRMADLRDRGDLYLSTLSQWGDYVRSVQQLEWIPSKNGVVIHNPGQTLPDITIASHRWPQQKPIAIEPSKVSGAKTRGNIQHQWLSLPTGDTMLHSP